MFLIAHNSKDCMWLRQYAVQLDKPVAYTIEKAISLDDHFMALIAIEKSTSIRKIDDFTLLFTLLISIIPQWAHFEL